MHMEQERHQNEMYMLQNEIKKWQDKYDMTMKDLQMKESAMHRIELELDSNRTDLERSKLQQEKMESSKQLQQNHVNELNREIDGWKEKYNKAQDEVIFFIFFNETASFLKKAMITAVDFFLHFQLISKYFVVYALL